MYSHSPLVKTAFLVTVLVAGLGWGQSQSEYDFMPDGGAALLATVLEECQECGSVDEVFTSERTREEWLDYLGDQQAVSDALTEAQVATVAEYLATVAPMPEDEVPDAGDPGSFPTDGRLFALQQCMNCHGITRPITLGWDRDRWFHLLEDATHGTIGISETAQELIASYLAHNAIPLDEVPEALRGAGPAY